MKRFSLFFCVSILVIAASAYAKGKPNTCSDVPISMMFDGGPGMAIRNDTGAAYVGGIDGIDNTVIHYYDGCLGSHDATMLIPQRSNRNLQFKLPTAIENSIIEGMAPNFAGGDWFSDKAFVNIRNVTGRGTGPNVPNQFYTRASFYFQGPDGKSYSLAYIPNTCPGDLPCVPNFTSGSFPSNVNQLVETAWVKVTYTPNNVPGNFGTWIAEGVFTDNVVRSTLVLDPGKNKPLVHSGQYSMPFRITIIALAPLPDPPNQ